MLALETWDDSARPAKKDNVSQGIEWARANARHLGIKEITVNTFPWSENIHWHEGKWNVPDVLYSGPA